MKILNHFTLVTSVFILSACQNNAIDFVTPSINYHASEVDSLFVPCKNAISTYIDHIVRPYKTRSNDIIELQPIVIDNDTLMYYVNYENGWELFSNNYRMPMTLMKSDNGQFNYDELVKTPEFNIYFSGLIDDLKLANASSIESSIEIDDSWPVSINDRESNEGNSEDGHWVNVGYDDSKTISIEIPHIIQTYWSPHENSKYALIDSISKSKSVSSIDISTSQYLKFAHDRISKPEKAPLYVSIYSDYESPYFYDFSTEIWNLMNEDIDYVNVWIGYISYLNQTCYVDMTRIPYTKFSKSLGVVKSLAGIALEESKIDRDYIHKELISGWPILAHSQISTTRDNKYYKGYAGFLIDAYNYYHSDLERFSIWCDCGLPNGSCDRDIYELVDEENITYEELVERFGYNNVKRSTITSHRVLVAMNWGMGASSKNNIFCSLYSSEWVIPWGKDNRHHTDIKIGKRK